MQSETNKMTLLHYIYLSTLVKLSLHDKQFSYKLKKKSSQFTDYCSKEKRIVKKSKKKKEKSVIYRFFNNT